MVLEAEAIDLSYGPLQVLFSVSLRVHEGEVLAVLGANGAGKSTLLRAVSGLSRVDRGTVRLRGVDVTKTSAEQRVRAGVALVQGGQAVFPTLTVRENLQAAGTPLGRDRHLLAERTEQVLDVFPRLRERFGQSAGTMSGGERQMLGLAKGLMLDAQVLCIDELSLGLAPVVVQELVRVVDGLRSKGVTMVIVEQSPNVALGLADRAIVLEKGHVRFEGPAATLLHERDVLRGVFFGSDGAS